MAFVPVAAGLTRLGRDSQVSTLAPRVVYSAASSPSTPSCLTAGVSRLLRLLHQPTVYVVHTPCNKRDPAGTLHPAQELDLRLGGLAAGTLDLDR